MNICWKSLLISFIVYLYIILVSLFMITAEDIFGQIGSYLGITAFLLLLVISAGITGGLIVGIPAMKIIKGDKSKGILLFFANIGWLIIFAIITFIVIYFVK